MSVSLDFLCAMAKLDEQEREVIVERHLRGLSMRQAGEVIGISQESVRRREARAFRKLRGDVDVWRQERAA